VTPRGCRLQGEDVTVLTLRDVTGERQREAAFAALQQQLLVAQKMDAVGRLSAGIAHDFNNCLQAIVAYTDVLLGRYPTTPMLTQNLAGVRDAAERGAAFTRQLLGFARQQARPATVVDLNRVVGGLGTMLARLLPEPIQLLVELHPEVRPARIDPAQLEQVLVNLAVNARDAMPGGGVFCIQTLPVRLEDADVLAGLPPGDYTLLSVSDTGHGMEPETVRRAFEPFYTTRPDGTGLGLAIVHGIVAQSGGHVLVDSHPGRGTQILIYLPEADGEPAPLDSAHDELAPQRGWERLLLVEDNEHVRVGLVRGLTSLGYEVLPATSAEEALAIARVEPVHALVTDVAMPSMTGLELAAHLQRRQPGLRVVYISGYSESGVPDCDPATAAWLQKPFRIEVLASTLRRLLGNAAPRGDSRSRITAGRGTGLAG
jgi:two-component system cell cycle sensor histidine kinase/response regulator CckA